MGFFSGLSAEKYDRQYSDKKLLQRMLAYFRKQTKQLLIIFVTVIVRAVIEAITPVIVARGLDRGYTRTNHQPLHTSRFRELSLY
jgi:ATP-binding cassette, subfamily B, bacterial